MDNISLPKDLLQTIANNLIIGAEIDFNDFEKIARWRRACGDAEGASKWQTWSLLAPESPEIIISILEILENTWEQDEPKLLKRKLKNYIQSQNWLELENLLKSNQIAASIIQQDKLIRDNQKLRPYQLEKICKLWEKQKKPDQIIKLLNFFISKKTNTNRNPRIRLLISLANLLEQEMRYHEARKWLEKAHQLEPKLPTPLLRLARLSLRQNQPHLAVRYTSLILDADPNHDFAMKLQRKANRLIEKQGSNE